MLLTMLKDLILHNTGKEIYPKVIVTDSTKSPIKIAMDSSKGKGFAQKW